MTADILAGQPLRPTTPVPGLWLVDAPDILYVRVYTAPPLVSQDPPPPPAGDASSSNTPQLVAPPPDPASLLPAAEDTVAELSKGSTSPTSHLQLSLSPTKLAVPSPSRSPLTLSLPKSPTTALSLPRSPVQALKGSQPGTPRPDDGPKLATPTRSVVHATGVITRPPSPSTTLDRLRTDPLEHAWLAINASDIDVTKAALASPCAVVKPGDERRELWIFSPTDGPVAAIEDLGLTELEVPEPIRIADTVTCPTHGHELSCLEPSGDAGDEDKQPCCPTFTPPEIWPLLESAVGEKVAWKLGTRMSLLPSDSTLTDPPFDVSLRPAPGKLILTAVLRPLPRCAPQRHSRTEPGVDPLVLRPLALPALLVSSISPTSAQDLRLSATFDLHLGPSWKHGRSEARVAAQAAYGCSADWSVYWVPLGRGEEDLARTLPHALATKWRGSNGVLTVWPTHLARPLARSVPPVPAKLSPPEGHLGSSPDLMNMATEVFEFLASYTAPSEEDEEDAEADGEEPPEVDGDVAMEDDSKASDVDDLFSAHTSPAPTASRAVSRAPTIVTDAGELFTSSAFGTPGINALDVDMGMEEDLFGDDDTATVVPENEEPPSMAEDTPAPEQAMLPPPVPPTTTQMSSRIGSPRDITEDDFNFFDSPTASTSPEKLLQEPVSHAPHPPLDDHTGKELATPANAYLSLPLPDATPASLPSVIEEDDVEIVAAEPPAPEAAVPEVQGAEPVLEAAQRPPAKEDEVSQKHSFTDIVPEAFAPVQLGKRKRPKFAYGLPSPAATVTSLRTSCVERLRVKISGKDKEEKYVYTRAWDIESDGSDSEDDSPVTTGAPPTPSSTISYDDRTPANELAMVPTLPDDEVEYDGTVCVGGEWTSLQFDTAAASTLARSWGSTWVDITPNGDYPTPTSPPRSPDTPQPQLSVEVLANAIVRNSFFRSMFETSDLTAREPSGAATMLVRSGVAVSDVTAALADGETFSLSQAAVNVGFGSSVMRLNASGLRYWRELGLSPSGGPKDLAAFVVCAPGIYNVKRATEFLNDMAEVYAAHRLGTLTTGTHELAANGIAAVASVEIGATVSRLRGTSLASSLPTVVFVLTSTTELTPATLAPLLAAKGNTSWVYPLPVNAVHSLNLATAAFQVYDLVPRQVDRVTMFGKPLDMPKVWMGYHAFTLAAADATPKPELSMTWPQRNYDVLNRWRLVHSAYTWIPEWESVIVAVADASGDAFDVQSIRMDATSSARDRVARVWDVVRSFASDAATEWRASVTRYGLMSSDEVEAWKSVFASHHDPMTVAMCEPSGAVPHRTRAPVANVPSSTFTDPAAEIIDETLAASAATFKHRLAVTLPPSSEGETRTIFPPTSFVLGMSGPGATGAATATFHILLHRNPPGREEKAGELLGPEFYRLACLGRRRYDLGTLPLPLDAVGKVAMALEKIERPDEEEDIPLARAVERKEKSRSKDKEEDKEGRKDNDKDREKSMDGDKVKVEDKETKDKKKK